MTSADHDVQTYEGGDARSPTEFGARDYWQVARRVFGRVGSDDIGLIAAGVAFYALLSLFPGLAAVVAAVGIFTDPAEVLPSVEPVVSLLPEEAATIILGQIDEITGSSTNGLTFAALIAFALSVYSASKGTGKLISGLNLAYQETEERGFFRLILTTLALTLFVVAVMVAALAVLAVIPALARFIAENEILDTAVSVARWPILLGLALTLFAGLYRYGPSRDDAEWRWLAPGCIAACLLWVGGTVAFTFYVQNFGSYNETFGTLAGVIVLLMWLWLSAFVTLLGALLDAELEAQTSYDTTTGPDEPMGARGATVADMDKG